MKRQLTKVFPNVNKDNFPTDNQLKNYLNYKKQKEGLKAHLNLGELEKWCIQHEAIPDDDDEMFVKRSFRVERKSYKVVLIIN